MRNHMMVSKTAVVGALLIILGDSNGLHGQGNGQDTRQNLSVSGVQVRNMTVRE